LDPVFLPGKTVFCRRRRQGLDTHNGSPVLPLEYYPDGTVGKPQSLEDAGRGSGNGGKGTGKIPPAEGAEVLRGMNCGKVCFLARGFTVEEAGCEKPVIPFKGFFNGNKPALVGDKDRNRCVGKQDQVF
jgi:hypothetical protein